MEMLGIQFIFGRVRIFIPLGVDSGDILKVKEKAPRVLAGCGRASFPV
jgi:hypothetical protein